MSDTNRPYVIRDLAKAMKHVKEGKSFIPLAGDDTLEDWEVQLDTDPLERGLGYILLAAEELLNARIHLSCAMWNSTKWE